jgi:hypothetical protein
MQPLIAGMPLIRAHCRKEWAQHPKDQPQIHGTPGQVNANIRESEIRNEEKAMKICAKKRKSNKTKGKPQHGCARYN